MAEGPVVHYYSRQLSSVLQNKRVEIVFGPKKLKAAESSLQGAVVTGVEAHGKQFRIHISDGRILLVHLMMWGSWRIYRNGATWDKPLKNARLIMRTDSHEVVVFSAPIVKLLTQSEFLSEPRWSDLGPDPLREDFSEDEFSRRFDGCQDREIGAVIMDQQVVSGIGNILKSEILYRARVDPRRLVSKLSARERDNILHWTKKLMRTWLDEIPRGRKNSWIQVYRKSGQLCPDCRDTIQFFRQAKRITFACPTCQK